MRKKKYIRASEYLGNDSHFLINDPKLEKKAGGKIKALDALNLSLTQTPTKSTKKFFANTPNNIFSPKMILRAALSQNGIPLIPNQLRSLNNNKVAGAKRLFTEEEISLPQNGLMVSVNYFTISQIEYLSGFSKLENGTFNMKNPDWLLVDSENVDGLSTGTFCKIERIKNSIMDHETDSRVDLPFSDSHFIISDEELPSTSNIAIEDTESSAYTGYATSMPYNIAGSTNEIIIQNTTTEEQIFKASLKDVTIESGTRETANVRSTPTRPAISGVRSSTSRGGGY